MLNSPARPQPDIIEVSDSDYADGAQTSREGETQVGVDKIRATVAAAFDEAYYLENNPQVQELNLNALDHYLAEGWRDGCRPARDFDPFVYRYIYLDVAQSEIEPFYHYLTVGRQEGRHTALNLDIDKLAIIEPYVDKEWYHEIYTDVKETAINPVLHYYYWGWKEGRNPSLNFDTNEYLAAHPALIVEQRNPLLDHLQAAREAGPQEAIVFSSVHAADFSGDPLHVMQRLFDSAFYFRANPDIAKSGIDPFMHFSTQGWKEGRAPNAWFDASFYLETYADVRQFGINPFLHFITTGRSEGRQCNYPGYRHGVNIAFDYWRPSDALALPVMRQKAGSQAPAMARPDERRPRILVHLHVYYEEVIEDIVASLRNIPEPFDAIVTSAKAELKTSVHDAFGKDAPPQLNAWTWVDCPNRGRDIAPWVVDVLPHAQRYEIGLHIHTKHSLEKGDLGGRWRRDLIEKLLFDPQYVRGILAQLSEPTLGLVYPTPFAEIEHQMGWGLNRSLAQNLVTRILGPQALLKSSTPQFPAGMMFWYRPSAVASLAKLKLKYEDFPKEPIRDDGTLAHALERIVGTVVQKTGSDILKVRPAPAEQIRANAAAPVISVIVPAKNAETWISDCIESIRDQVAETPSFEIIVVENNSTDRTRKVLRRFEAISNVRIMSADRQGAGGARNAGLEVARGRYVAFVDADDLIVRDALSTLFTQAEAHKASLACSQLRMFYPDSSIERAMPQAQNPAQNVIKNSELFAAGTNYQVGLEVERAMRALLNDFGPCCKLYSKAFLTENDIKFQEGVNFEDNLFVYKAYAHADTICVVPKVTYLYRKPHRNTVKLTQSTAKSCNAFVDQVGALSAIVSQVVAEKTSEPWRRIALEAISTKLTNTLNDYPLWTESPAMRNPVVALSDSIKQMQAQ